MTIMKLHYQFHTESSNLTRLFTLLWLLRVWRVNRMLQVVAKIEFIVIIIKQV
jgi:hypothetical protein